MLRAVSRCLAPCALLLTFGFSAQALAAGDPIMPLSQVQRGMHCTGYSVIRGTDISSFDVTIDDIVSDASEDTSILATVSGPAVDSTGVGPGFSGSPVYCPSPSDGTPEVAGAIAIGLGDYGNKTLLLTPIEKMLGEPVSPPSSARRAPRLLRQARPLALPLSIAGLSPAVSGFFARAAKRAGRLLIGAPSAPRVDFPVQTLRPGSAMAVGLSSGDIEGGAIGTVTYVDGSNIWAFGHPLDSAGPRSLFLQDAYVYSIINNPAGTAEATTYKLAAPGHDIGTLTGDGIFAVTGIVGALPPHFPLVVNATDGDTGAKQTLVVQVADERGVGNPTGLSPLNLMGTATVAQAAYDVLHGSPVHTSGEMCATFTVAERSKPMRFCNTYVSSGTGEAADGAGSLAGVQPVVDFGSAAGMLDGFQLGPLHITSIDVELTLRRGLSQAFMTGVHSPTRQMHRGRSYPLTVALTKPGGAKSKVTIRVRVPHDIPKGKRDLVLTGTPSDVAGGGTLSDLLQSLLATPDERGPLSVSALAKEIAGIQRYDGVTASFRPPRRKGEDIGSPASPDSLPSGAEGRALRERPVYRNPKLRLSSAVAVRVTIV
jgi:hypothetical protein